MNCRLCGHKVERFMDFGDVALAGAFLKPEQFADERRYPLSVSFCASCYGVQVDQQIGPHVLFGDYFYHTSQIGTMRAHFATLAREIAERFKPDMVLEIGCNDGVLLRPLADLGVLAVGIDPAPQFAHPDDERLTVINAHFPSDQFFGKADVIAACNVLAHIEDVPSALDAVRATLTDDGVFIAEVNRLDAMVTDLQYDWIYHEHRHYYSLLTLTKLLAAHGLHIFDCQCIPTHAGSMRIYASPHHNHTLTRAYREQIDHELWVGLHEISRFVRFAAEAQAHRDELRDRVQSWVDRGEQIAGYGACGRANTLLQFCGFDSRHIAYMVDDAPAKHGFCTPGSHIQIRATLGQPDVCLVFAWSFLQEIASRNKAYRGQLITPLPNIVYHSLREAA